MTEETANVLDFKTGEPLLPKTLRAALKGQYLESKELDHDPEKFVTFLEQRLAGAVAQTLVTQGRKIIEELRSK